MAELSRTPYLKLDTTNDPLTGPLEISVPAINTDATWTALRLNCTKTLGVTDAADFIYGVFATTDINQPGGVLGHLTGSYFATTVRDGDVDFHHGISGFTSITGGQVHNNSAGIFMTMYIDAAEANLVRGAYIGCNVSAFATINDDAIGLDVFLNKQVAIAGDAIALRVQDNSADFAIYQTGTAPSRLLGQLSIGATAPSVNYEIGAVNTGIICAKEGATPTADAGYGKFYCKDDNKAYFQDGAGVEHELAFV
jgi:hypothetical protein